MNRTLALAAASAVALVLAAAPSAGATPSCHSPGGLTKTCIDTTGSCLVGQYRTTPAGTGYYCLVRRPSSSRGTGPCATVAEQLEDANVQVDVHSPEAAALVKLACSKTG